MHIIDDVRESLELLLGWLWYYKRIWVHTYFTGKDVYTKMYTKKLKYFFFPLLADTYIFSSFFCLLKSEGILLLANHDS